MLVCGNCARRGKKDTVILIKGIWRYNITSTPSKQLIFALEEEIKVPSDWWDTASLVRYSCARCTNEFFIPSEWVKKGKINMSEYMKIYGLKRMPVCTNCRNDEKFLFFGNLPRHLQSNGKYWFISKIVNDRDENMSDMESVKIIKRSLIECDDTIPVQCRQCHSHDVDLVPAKNEFKMSQHDFDVHFVGAE